MGYQERTPLLHIDNADDLSSRQKMEAQSSSGVNLHDSTYLNRATCIYLIWPGLWSVTDTRKETEN